MIDHRALQMSNQEFAAWNEQMAKRYDPDLYHRSSNWIVRWVEGSRVERIIHFLGANTMRCVLEVGVGAGNILERMPAAKKIGIDLSPFLLEKARARLGNDAELILGDAETLEEYIPPHSVDRAYCSEVLEHVRNPDAVLSGMASTLATDGIAVVSVPNEGFINRVKSWLKALGIFRILFPNMADHMEHEWHVREFSRQQLHEYCSKHFSVERIDAVPFPFFPIRFVAKLRPKVDAQQLPESLLDAVHTTVSPTQPAMNNGIQLRRIHRFPPVA